MHERERMLRKARKTKQNSDWSSYKSLKNWCNNIKHLKRKYPNNLIAENSKDPEK